MRHEGINLGFSGQLHRINLTELTGGKTITVYGQHEVVKDLIATRLSRGEQILFDVAEVQLDGITTTQPRIYFRYQDQSHAVTCDWVAGCDGYHGVSRGSIPSGELTVFEKTYPFAWLGILADAPPSWEELIYANHERGLALFSMRFTKINRLYLKCRPDEDHAKWSDDRIWENLQKRLSFPGDKTIQCGEILQKSVTTMRSFVVEPMRYGRSFLTAIAAHVVPPTGACRLKRAVGEVTLPAQ